MNTPVSDFVKNYAQSGMLRLHMPGHKGHAVLGPEALDITEVDGADVLYSAKGVIRQSEENASSLFGTGETLYSAEGSSLCIRAMLYLAALHARARGKRPVIAAGRNAHKVFMTAAALMDIEVVWLFPREAGSLVSCELDLYSVEKTLAEEKPAAVYVTSPDYLGNLTDVRALGELCRRYGTLLLVDNAHGAYLKFLPQSLHPIDLGADLCCDSAHKTLPVLTGGAYLHVAKTAPELLRSHAQNALSLFASTSPSYLILQSLDNANHYLTQGYAAKLHQAAQKLADIRERLGAYGYAIAGQEPMKLTLGVKPLGWRGDEVAQYLHEAGVECEFADPDFVVMMFTPEISPMEMERTADLLCALPKRPAIRTVPPVLEVPVRRMKPHDALFSPQEELPVEAAVGRVLAAASVTCPPAVPVVVCGEEITASALECFQYYGIETCFVVKE